VCGQSEDYTTESEVVAAGMQATANTTISVTPALAAMA